MTFFPMLPYENENSEQESNPIPQLLNLYLSRSAFLVSSTDLNKQLFNVKSVFNFLNHRLSIQEIYEFITFSRDRKIIFY